MTEAHISVLGCVSIAHEHLSLFTGFLFFTHSSSCVSQCKVHGSVSLLLERITVYFDIHNHQRMNPNDLISDFFSSMVDFLVLY